MRKHYGIVDKKENSCQIAIPRKIYEHFSAPYDEQLSFTIIGTCLLCKGYSK